MKQPSELTREQLADIVGRIRDILWQDPVTGELDPDRSWDVETIEGVSGVVEDAGLKPDPVRPASRTAEAPPRGPLARGQRHRGAAGHRDADGPGGVHQNDRGDRRLHPARTIGRRAAGRGRDRFDEARPVPVGDEGWPDLADAYVLACGALGRVPMVRDADADPSHQDGEG